MEGEFDEQDVRRIVRDELRSESETGRRDLLKAAGALGVGGLLGGASTQAMDVAAADASSSDSDGDIGTPSNRVDAFLDGADQNVATFTDTATDPASNGELRRNGTDVKVYSGGSVKNLSDIGSGGGFSSVFGYDAVVYENGGTLYAYDRYGNQLTTGTAGTGASSPGDAHTVIQAAADEAEGGRLYIAPRSDRDAYYLNGTVTIDYPTVVEGGGDTSFAASVNGTVLYRANGVNADLFNINCSNTYMSGTAIRNLSMYGNKSNNTSGDIIDINGTNANALDMYFEDLFLIDTPDWVIDLNSFHHNFWFTNCMVEQGGSGGIRMNQANWNNHDGYGMFIQGMFTVGNGVDILVTGSGGQLNNMQVVNSLFRETNQEALRVANSGGLYYTQFAGVNFRDCCKAASNTYNTIHIDSANTADHSFNGCHFVGAASTPKYHVSVLNGDYVIVKNGTYYGSGTGNFNKPTNSKEDMFAK